jgi:hypothetical protein
MHQERFIEDNIVCWVDFAIAANDRLSRANGMVYFHENIRLKPAGVFRIGMSCLYIVLIYNVKKD